MRTKFLTPIIVLLTLTGITPIAPGQVIARHDGATDPTTEGLVFTLNGTANVGPIVGDMGLDAWKVAATGDVHYQTNDLPLAVKTEALSKGWMITLRARVAAAPDSRGLITCNLENIGGRRFDIGLGRTAGGDTYVRLNTNIQTSPQLVGIGPTYTLTGAGTGYHLYQLRYDPQTATADLFVDGVERISDYAGHTNFVRPFGFYIASYQNHIGHYNLARFEILDPAAVPAVSEWGLVCMVVTLLVTGTIALRRVT